MELNIADIIETVAGAVPEREAVIDARRRLTWAEFDDRCSRFGAALVELGLGTHGDFADAAQWESIHDHVALYLHNSHAYLEAMIGSYAARCGPVNVNYRYKADELRHVLTDSRARVVVHDRQFTETLAEVVPTLPDAPLLVSVDDGTPVDLPAGTVDYEDFLAAAPTALDDERRSSRSGDDLYLCYTGGTTGMPKGVLWRQADFVVSALRFCQRDGTEFDDLAEIADAAPRSTLRALPAPPLMHGAAHWNALSCLFSGGTVVIQHETRHLDPDDIWRTVERERATSLLVVGDPFARPLLRALQSGSYDTSSLRHILSGGAVLGPETKRALTEALRDITIVDVLGSSESGRQAVAKSSGSSSDGFRPESTATIIAEDLRGPLPTDSDEIGWLAQSGRVPLGYLGDPAKTEATFPTIDGARYAVAGDRARWNPDGSIALLGRDSVCINTGGEKVFAEEVETTLVTHPAVIDAVVTGRPSEIWGSEVVAVVAVDPDSPVEDDELVAHCKARLADFKAPKAIVRVPHVQRSPSGKADYRWASALVTG